MNLRRQLGSPALVGVGLVMMVFFATQDAAAQAIPGLVAHYTFDGHNATDASGNGHNGTLAGGPTFASGPAGFGDALVADIGKYVVLPSTAALSLNNHSFTVTAWVNATAFHGLGGYGSDWAMLGNQTGPGGLHLVLRGGQPYMGFLGNDIGSGVNLSLNTWYHIAWRYNTVGGEQALFLNGALIAIGGGHPAFNGGTGSTFIGRCCETWDSPRYAKGRIDDVRIYDRALSPAEIASLTAPPPPPGPASCSAILLDGDSTGDGLYTIDPAQNGTNVTVYCDMTTRGGGWTLAGYGANSNLLGTLDIARGAYHGFTRTGSANIASVQLARGSTQVALSWAPGSPSGNLQSYAEAVSWLIPSPSTVTLTPSNTANQCLSAAYTPVTVNSIVGTPNLPATMYTRTASLGASYGQSYGLVRSNGNPQCDWYIDGQQFRAVYLGINSGPLNRGVVYEPGGSSNHVTPATMAIWFRGDVPDVPADTTAPVVTATVTGVLGNNGWYTSNVTVSWSVSDDESTATSTGCDEQTVSADTAGVTFTCSATSEGGTASASVTVKRDATAPAIVGSRGASNSFGWNNGPVAVSFACSDAGSGLAACDGDAVVSSEGAGQSVTGTASDLAGNTAGVTVGDINIDLTAPTVSITSPTTGSSHTLGAVVAAAYSCSDALSGINTCTGTVGSGAAINTASVGTKTFTVTSTDRAGNTSSSTVTYRVAYVFGGFRQPIPLPVSTFKGGSTIPVKFGLSSASGASVGTAVVHISVNGGGSLGVATYDAAAQQYHFNLKTKGLPLGPLTITATLDDGTTQSAAVVLK